MQLWLLVILFSSSNIQLLDLFELNGSIFFQAMGSENMAKVMENNSSQSYTGITTIASS